MAIEFIFGLFTAFTYIIIVHAAMEVVMWLIIQICIILWIQQD
jgi:hypothetical protein